MNLNILNFLKNFRGNLIFYYLTFFFVLGLFCYVYYLSLNFIINYWVFSQAHINFFEGYVKRGFFGSIMIFLENYLHIKASYTFSIFFIIFNTINIILFFKIIKQYSDNLILFIFLSLSPTLIMFSFNDLGGYQRFDIISIFLILIHTHFCLKFRSFEISEKSYKKFFNIFLIPGIFLSLLVHEIQLWTILLHFILTKNIFQTFKIEKVKYIPRYLILILPVIFVFFYPVSDAVVIEMMNNISNRELWFDAIKVASQTKNNMAIVGYELNTNFFNVYNLKINLFFLAMSIIPIHLFLYYFNKEKIIDLKNFKVYEMYFCFLPLISFFAIGDAGRWIHLISLVTFANFAQFPYIHKSLNLNSVYKNILKFICLIFVLVYVFFIRLPHCCNLEAKNITIWGGLGQKFISAYHLLVKTDDDFYKLNKRFKKN